MLKHTNTRFGRGGAYATVLTGWQFSMLKMLPKRNHAPSIVERVGQETDQKGPDVADGDGGIRQQYQPFTASALTLDPTLAWRESVGQTQ